MSYLHPEKVFGVGLRPIDRVINLMATIPAHGDNNDNIDAVMKKLSKGDKKTILKMLEDDRKGKDGFTDSASHAMKAVIDIKKNGKIPIYSIGKQFFQHVKMLDRDIPISHINLNDKHVYFTFNDSNFEGAYVTSEIWKKNEESEAEFMALRVVLTPKVYGISNMKVFNFAIIGKSFNFSGLYHSTTGEELKDYAKTFENTGKSVIIYAGDYGEFKGLLVGVLNSLIYVNSQDPDIEALKPLKLYQKKELNLIDAEKRKQIRTVPINLVSWSMYGKRYNVDQTVVSPHMRWQPCGPNRSQIKLVWVKEHVRKYSH